MGANMLDDMFSNTNRRSYLSLPLAWLQSPGFAAITCWRVARRLNSGGPMRKLLSAVIWRYGVVGNGCDISIRAQIGPGLRLPHPVGVVIGEGTVIGSNVTIYQNVTLGRAKENENAYPVIHDGCTLFAGAVLIGHLEVGAGAKVGANSVVLRNVASGATVAGAPARELGAGSEQTQSPTEILRSEGG